MYMPIFKLRIVLYFLENAMTPNSSNQESDLKVK